MTRYEIDPDASEVRIAARSSVHPINSRTQGLAGWIELSPTAAGGADLRASMRAHLELAVSRLRSSNPLEERELRRRIDARRHPFITGDVTGIAKGERPGRYRVTGDVTFRGITRVHEDEVEITAGPDTVTVNGTSTFDVRDFGMEPPKILVLRVEPLVVVTIDVLARRTA